MYASMFFFAQIVHTGKACWKLFFSVYLALIDIGVKQFQIFVGRYVILNRKNSIGMIYVHRAILRDFWLCGLSMKNNSTFISKLKLCYKYLFVLIEYFSKMIGFIRLVMFTFLNKKRDYYRKQWKLPYEDLY